jgi:L-threonylcarbamoyladenylate synthase
MDIIAKAVWVLQRDGLIVYPTDTVYGLGADALSDHAILKVYEAKNRPLSNPISIAVCDMEMAHAVAVIPAEAEELMERFLPGPFTVIVPAKSLLPEILTAGTRQIGVRIPDYPLALSIIEAFDGPITATSANRSGERDPTRREEVHVPHDLFISGDSLSGMPSTVIDPLKRTILRRGERWIEIEAFFSTFR